ncbi:MAG: hypothetical protein V2A62_05695 [Candidatus Woesearchaeota archaeon]
MEQKKLAVIVFILSATGLLIFSLLIFSLIFEGFYVSSTGCISSLAAFLPLLIIAAGIIIKKKGCLTLILLLLGIFVVGLSFSFFKGRMNLFSLLLGLALFTLFVLFFQKEKIDEKGTIRKDKVLSKKNLFLGGWITLILLLIPTFYILLSELSLYYGIILVVLAFIFAGKIDLFRGMFYLSLWGLIESSFYSYVELFWRNCPDYVIEHFWGGTVQECQTTLFFPTCFYSLILFLILTGVLGVYLYQNKIKSTLKPA